MQEVPFEARHHSFLETLRVLYKSGGARYAADAIMATGASAARGEDTRAYDSIEAFYVALEHGDTTINAFEGRSRHFGDGVFGLPGCPFAEPLRSYAAAQGDPREFREITEQMNRSSPLTRRMRVGEGSAVNPFCVLHQPVRSAMGERITVCGRPVLVYQLGCRARSGDAKLAERWLEVTKVDRALVHAVLEQHACCFCVRLAR